MPKRYLTQEEGTKLLEETKRQELEWASKMNIKECEKCHIGFYTPDYSTRYCDDCQAEIDKSEYRKRKYRELNAPQSDKLDKNVVSRLSKMKVAEDLLKQGFELFEAVAVTDGPDFIIRKNGICLSVKAKTGHYTSATGEAYNPSRINRLKSDVFAFVFPDKIAYDPKNPIHIIEEKTGEENGIIMEEKATKTKEEKETKEGKTGN